MNFGDKLVGLLFGFHLHLLDPVILVSYDCGAESLSVCSHGSGRSTPHPILPQSPEMRMFHFPFHCNVFKLITCPVAMN